MKIFSSTLAVLALAGTVAACSESTTVTKRTERETLSTPAGEAVLMERKSTTVEKDD